MHGRIKYIFLIIVCLVISIYLILTNKDRKLKRDAITYFTQKYDLTKKDIKVIKNGLYLDPGFCLDGCADNEMIIQYKNKKYSIVYSLTEKMFTDNFQEEIIKKDMEKFFQKRYPFVSKSEFKGIDALVINNSIKYENDIEEYLKKIDKTFLWGRFWIKSLNDVEATNNWQEYNEKMITDLEKFNFNYNVAFSKEKTDNEYSAFYYYHVYDENFYFYDRVSAKKTNCNRKSLNKGNCF